MPCDAIYDFAVNFGTCNKDILFDSLKEAGMNPRRAGESIFFTFEGRQAVVEDGSLTVRGAEPAQTERCAAIVKQNFSAQVVKVGAKKFGWTVTTTAKNKLKIRHH